MENACIWTYIKYQHAKAQVKRGVKWFFSSESGGAGIIAAVILIVLVVVLGIAFKDSIQNLWNNIWKTAEDADFNPSFDTKNFGSGTGDGATPP